MIWQRLARWAVPDGAFHDPGRRHREQMHELDMIGWQLARLLRRKYDASVQPTLPLRQWAVYETQGVVHVAPIIDGELLETHRLAWDCPCFPTARRAGPLSDPYADRHEPTWPGANHEYVQ